MAVYTEIDDDELTAFLAGYELGELISYKGIAEGVENSNYLVQTRQGPFILTLYEKRAHPEDLPFFLALMEHLAVEGIPCPTPVHGRGGRVLRHLAGRPAAIVTFLQGFSLRRPKPPHCSALGRVLAELHLAGARFSMQRANSLALPGWKPLFHALEARADDIAPGLRSELAAELSFLEQNWPAGLPRGIIHADLFPDNVFFLDNKISGVIDFYFACNDALAYDIAICLNAWCFEPDHAFNITKARALLKGYAAARPLTDAEVAALPVLARGAALRFLLTRIYDWLHRCENAFVRPKDPLEYRRKLKFHQTARSAGDYGL